MFDSELTTIAFCWRLVRADGAALGFTSHDRDLEVGGLAYLASPGMIPAAVERGGGDAPEVAGAVTSDLLAAGDLAAGRWDGAASRLFAVDWTDPGGEQIVLATGTLGEVAIAGRRFEAALRGPEAALARSACETTSPTCRAELGDHRCRVDLAGRHARDRVEAWGDDGWIELDGLVDTEKFIGGRLMILDGPASGMAVRVVAARAGALRVAEAVGSAAPGSRVLLTEGCDKRFATCRDRFANAVNFRGEPFLPGNDLLTRYPGA